MVEDFEIRRTLDEIQATCEVADGAIAMEKAYNKSKSQETGEFPEEGYRRLPVIAYYMGVRDALKWLTGGDGTILEYARDEDTDNTVYISGDEVPGDNIVDFFKGRGGRQDG